MSDEKPEGSGSRSGRQGSCNHAVTPLYLIGPPPRGFVCCRCDEPIDDATAVNVPGLRARGWSHRACLPDWLLD